MRSALCLSVLLAAMGWGGPVRAASPSIGAAQVHRNLIRLDVNLHFTIPSGAMVVCKAELAPQTGSSDTGRFLFDPQGAAQGKAVLNGSIGVCAVEIPLCWTGNNPPRGVTLRYEIDAEKWHGEPPAVLKQGLLTVSLAGPSAASSTLNVSLNTIP